MSKCKLWERQDGESEKAFEAFVIYRDMGLERTVSAVVKRLEKSRNLLDRWKDRWDWETRAAAYDNYLDREAQKAAIREYKKMNQRHIETAKLLQSKALESLKSMEQGSLSPKDILAFLTKAVELERVVVKEQVTSNEDFEKVKNHANNPFAELTTDELRKLIDSE